MSNEKGSMYCKWVVGLVVLGVSLAGPFSIASVAAQTGPGTVCVLQIVAEGEVFSVVVDQPQNFNLALGIPKDKEVNIPIPCDSLSTLALGVSNQKNNNINVATQVFTHNGELICAKGPFLLAVNGGRGITFADCQ
jgi:hypothetical protein